MPTAKLTLVIPEDIWIGTLSREYNKTAFNILTVLPKDSGGVALAEITGPAGGEIINQMGEFGQISEMELLQQTEEAVLVQFEMSDPVFLLPIKKAGTPLELPFTIRDGHIYWEITATQDRLSKLATQLREFEIQFHVRSVTREIETEQLLTDRQNEILSHAVDAGYYDTPRECSLTELADDRDLAKSTCSETLHRAEEKIIKHFTADIDRIEMDSITSPE